MRIPLAEKTIKGKKCPARKVKILLAIVLAWKTPVLIILFLSLFNPLPVSMLQRDKSTVVLGADYNLLTAYLSADDKWRFETKLDDVPEFVQKSVVYYEDRWFYFHPGVNPVSIIRAALTNMKHGHVVVGGSTLTMQVARMMDPRPRTIQAKMIEIFRAFQLEVKYSKKEILELYFNLAPYGGNIEGFAAASYFYFGKPPAVLSRSESISLVGLPNSPTRLRPDRNFEESQRHRKILATLLKERGAITEKDFHSLVTDEMPRARKTLPVKAPHFSRLVADKHPELKSLNSTLNSRLQTLSEKALASHLEALSSHGITNGAVVIIENSTRSVRAMVGSANFYDTMISGQVNGATAPRSPGSAMKPFVYALAFDRGFLSPRLMLEDVPVNYSGYQPVNFDEKNHGAIPAEEALKLSLNVPAVNIYSHLGDDFLTLLRTGGITTLNKPREHYGLPLVLGSGEVTLLELTNLYAALADGGLYRPYALLTTDNPVEPVRILSEGATYITTEILSDVRRPDLPNCWEFSVNLPKVAWKTGTSYGHRDAWSIGYNPEYTVGVWLGNFSGRGSEMLVGSEAAAPLLFDIYNSLSTNSSWFKKPVSVGRRKVCAISGMPATENCPQTVEENHLYGVSPATPCTMHKKYALDQASGMRLSPDCLSGKLYDEKIYELWPSRIATWRRREGFPVDVVPPYLDNCDHVAEGGDPVIVSPAHNSKFYLRSDAPLTHQRILLDASVPNTVEKIFWFVDGELYASGSPDSKNFYTPSPGLHTIACVDTAGRSSEVTIRIN